MQQRADIPRAFTLIELLAVLAIVAVIAALLFPVSGRVLENSRSAGCLSNLRQIGTGLSLYAGENNGALPNQAQGPISQPTFWGAIGPYIDWPENVGPGANAAKGTIGHCPNHTEHSGSFSYVGSSVFFRPVSEPATRLVAIENGSRKPLVFEVHTVSWWPNVNSPVFAGKQPGALRWEGKGAHGKGDKTFNNTLFADFHVEAWPADGKSFRWNYSISN